MQCVGVQIAGGSGITPMLQVASEIVNNPEDKTQVSLIFANQTEKDIILKEEIDEMAAKHDNFQVGCVCTSCAVLQFVIMRICGKNRLCCALSRNFQRSWAVCPNIWLVTLHAVCTAVSSTHIWI